MGGATQIMFTWQMMALLMATMFLHLVGFVTPGWVYMEEDSLSLQGGFWYGVVCHGNNCTTGSVDTLDPYFHFPESKTLSQMLVKYNRIAMTALACTIIAILTDIAHKRTDNKLWSMWSVGICIITVFMSGILGIIAPTHFSYKLQTATDFYTHRGLENPYWASYSTVFTGLGGLLALVTYSVIAYKVTMARD